MFLSETLPALLLFVFGDYVNDDVAHSQSDFSGELELERRTLELLRRQRDIDMGKVTDKYAEYVLTVPKPEREKHHPRTPNKFRLVSRRAWDGMIKKWRKHLHNIGDPEWVSDLSLSFCVSIFYTLFHPTPYERSVICLLALTC